MKTKRLLVLFGENQKGLSMPTVLMVLMIVTVLGTALYAFSQNELLIATRSTDSKQAEYLARSGIEAALEWWKQEKPKPEGTKNFDRVYMKRDGTMVLDDPGHEKVGYIDVTVTKEADRTWIITSEGTVNGITKTLKASSGKFMTDEDLTSLPRQWYTWDDDSSTGYMQKGTTKEKAKEANMYVHIHDPVEGVAIVGLPGRTLELNLDNDDYGVGYSANALFFKSKLNLEIYGDFFDLNKKGFIVVAAERIVFDDTVGIRYGLLSGGVLVLYVPEGLGIHGQDLVVEPADQDLVDVNAKYGMVYFRNFLASGSSLTGISNQGFYFKQYSNEGIVLLQLEGDRNYSQALEELKRNGDLIPVANTVTKPDPEDCAVFFIN